MARQEKKTADARDLVNFHFSSSPPSQSHQWMAPRRPRRSGGGPKKNRQQDRRSEQDRSSARRKAASSMFYLHSSADHAFVITRRGPKQGFSFAGPDEAVSWEAVRSVKYLVPCLDAKDATQETCPICLEPFSSARITKCGHCFDLPCILRHVYTQTELNPSQAVKCPCCGLSIHTDDLRPVTLESVAQPRVRSRMTMVKLHRTRSCPAPYLPQRDAQRHASPHTAPVVTDRDAPYCRFNYTDPAIHQSQLLTNQAELESQLAELQRQGETNDVSNATEMIILQMSLEHLRRELQRAVDEMSEEEALVERFTTPNTGMYQMFPESVFAINSLRQTSASMVMDASEVSEAEPRERGLSMDSGDLSCGSDRRHRAGSIDSMDASTTGKDSSRQRRRPRRLPVLQATMYLDDESTHFYQSVDGQLCFLSRFNMNCLLEEFSATLPDKSPDNDLSPIQKRHLQPLPDFVEGNILEVESVHLTPELRKRMPFLSHLPVYTDVKFVELDLNAILSDETRQKFKAEFEKRRKRRKNKTATEKRADRIAKRQEEQRIEELKSRIQRIDPNDEFFQGPQSANEPQSLSGEEFGPALGTLQSHDVAQEMSSPRRNPALSFSEVTGRGFSVLNPTGMSEEEAFPSLTAASSVEESTSKIHGAARNTAFSGWHGSPVSLQSTAASQVGTSPPEKGKKSKGKKVVLFSTGGHRGVS